MWAFHNNDLKTQRNNEADRPVSTQHQRKKARDAGYRVNFVFYRSDEVLLGLLTEKDTPKRVTSVHRLMSLNTVESIKSIDVQTRVQYGMMIIFGTLCLVAAAAPLDLIIKVTAVSTLFGLTAGLWISHLVQITQRAAIRGEGATS